MILRQITESMCCIINKPDGNLHIVRCLLCVACRITKGRWRTSFTRQTG